MLVREYTESDLDALCRMHASQGFDYPFPDLADPIFVSKLVLEDDSGRPVMASLARITCEMYLLVDRADSSSGHMGRGVIPNPAAPNDPLGLARRNGADGGEGSAFASGEEEQFPRRPGGALCAGTPRNDSRLGVRTQAARQRYEWLLALHAAGERDLLARGLDDAHAWLPPRIARRFGRRLEALGWVRDDVWTPYCRRMHIAR
jgi:hypothetical protein